MRTAQLFPQGLVLCTQLLLGHGRPPLTRKLGTLGYPVVKTASICVPHFDTIPECDGRTDRQMDGWICCSIYSACNASFDMLLKHQKTV